jgi:hypothetical protein
LDSQGKGLEFRPIKQNMTFAMICARKKSINFRQIQVPLPVTQYFVGQWKNHAKPDTSFISPVSKIINQKTGESMCGYERIV